MPRYKFTSEYNKKEKKKYNTYDLSENIAHCFDTEGNLLFIFDREDYEKIKNICWSKDTRGYASGRIPDINKLAQVHRIILGIPQDSSNSIWIDHINRNPLDNRKSNLRIANKSQNRMNSSIRSDNTTGITGVYFRKDYNKWYAIITKNKKSLFLGYSENIEGAIVMRLKAEKEYFGEFAPQSHLFEKYGI